ncbi:unnamed protein product [Lota lota]
METTVSTFDRLSDGVTQPLLERGPPAGSRRVGHRLHNPSISHSVSWSSSGANASLSGATDFESDQDSIHPHPSCAPDGHSSRGMTSAAVALSVFASD